MKNLIFDDFQQAISDSTFTNRNYWDALSQMSACQCKVTKCLMSEIKTSNSSNPETIKMNNNSREVMEDILGEYLYNITLLCECMDISLFDVLLKEYKLINILGKYNLK